MNIVPFAGDPAPFLRTHLGKRLKGTGKPRAKHQPAVPTTREPVVLTPKHVLAFVNGHLQVVRKEKLT